MQAEIESFAAALGKASRAADNTVTNYRRDLCDFRRFLLERGAALDAGGEEVDAGAITADHVRGYLAEVMKTLSRATVQRRLFAIKAFFRWRETMAIRQIPAGESGAHDALARGRAPPARDFAARTTCAG